VLFAVDVCMIFETLQMRSDLSRHSEFHRQTFLQNGWQAMSLANRCEAGKRQVHFDDLAVSSGSETNAMIFDR